MLEALKVHLLPPLSEVDQRIVEDQLAIKHFREGQAMLVNGEWKKIIETTLSQPDPETFLDEVLVLAVKQGVLKEVANIIRHEGIALK